MKKFFLMIMLVSLCFLSTGCNKTDEVYKKIETNIIQGVDCISYPVYSDESTMLLSLGRKRKDIHVGPATITNAILSINIDEQTISKVVGISDNAQISSAVPFGDGVLYVSYEDMGNERLQWKILHSEENHTKSLLEGSCGSGFNLPLLDILSGEAVALWKNTDNSLCGLSVIKEDGVNNIIEMESPAGWSWSPVVFSKVMHKNTVAHFCKDNMSEYYVVNFENID